MIRGVVEAPGDTLRSTATLRTARRRFVERSDAARGVHDLSSDQPEHPRLGRVRSGDDRPASACDRSGVARSECDGLGQIRPVSTGPWVRRRGRGCGCSFDNTRSQSVEHRPGLAAIAGLTSLTQGDWKSTSKLTTGRSGSRYWLVQVKHVLRWHRDGQPNSHWDSHVWNCRTKILCDRLEFVGREVCRAPCQMSRWSQSTPWSDHLARKPAENEIAISVRRLHCAAAAGDNPKVRFRAYGSACASVAVEVYLRGNGLRSESLLHKSRAKHILRPCHALIDSPLADMPGRSDASSGGGSDLNTIYGPYELTKTCRPRTRNLHLSCDRFGSFNVPHCTGENASVLQWWCIALMAMRSHTTQPSSYI